MTLTNTHFYLDDICRARLGDYREAAGTLIFPDLTPSAPQHIRCKNRLQRKVSEIYTGQQQRDMVEASRYLIGAEYPLP